MKKIVLLLIALSVLAICSCEQPEEKPVRTNPKELVGKWENPNFFGDYVSFEFKSDGTHVYTWDKEVKTGIWYVEEERLHTELNGSPAENTSYSVEGETLRLNTWMKTFTKV